MTRGYRSRWQAMQALIRRRHERGQSLLELAIFLPLLLVFGLACLQFAVIMIAYVNLVNATRDAARWTSVHPNTTDGTVQTTVRNRRPPGMVPENLFITFSPACASLSSGICSGRTRDTMLVTTGRYVITPHIFLPTTFGFGSLVVTIPTSDLTYVLRMQVEPT